MQQLRYYMSHTLVIVISNYLGISLTGNSIEKACKRRWVKERYIGDWLEFSVLSE